MNRMFVQVLLVTIVLLWACYFVYIQDFDQRINGMFKGPFKQSAARNHSTDTDIHAIADPNITKDMYRSEVRRLAAGQGDFLDERYCNINCEPSAPCSYSDEVDFRIMVITYNRPESLAKCLNKIKHLDTMGKRLSVEVWIDRPENGTADNATLNVAEVAKEHFHNGRMCVHVQRKHANLGGQWRNTWRPKPATKEIGLILEDDVDISPHTYRYLKAVTEKYGDRDDVSGYSLQMHDINFFGLGSVRPMKGPVSENVFLYGVLGTWGFAPRPKAWQEFQDWFQSKNDSLRPIVPGISPTLWYQGFERQHMESTMWSQWHMYFSNISSAYCVYCNLVAYTQRRDVLLSVNRKEAGLHFRGKASSGNDQYLLLAWNETYLKFPANITKYNYHGIPIS